MRSARMGKLNSICSVWLAPFCAVNPYKQCDLYGILDCIVCFPSRAPPYLEAEKYHYMFFTSTSLSDVLQIHMISNGTVSC
jgi:hypothetical protein